MRVLPAILLLAILPASAAEFDVQASTFWTRAYSIPLAYSTTRFVLPANRFSAASTAIAPCGWSQTQDAAVVAFTRCRIDPGAEASLLARIRRLAPVKEIPERLPLPDYPELAFKRDALTKELASIEDSAEEVPAIRGLLETQISTLDEIAKYVQEARRPAVELLVVASTAASVVEDGQRALGILSQREQQNERPIKVHWIHHWARVSYPVCEQLPVVFVTRASPQDAAAEKALRAALGKHAEPYHEGGCRFTPSSQMYLTDLPLDRLVPALTALEGVTQVRQSPMMRYQRDLTDLERFDVLSAELTTRSAILAKTPTIRAFVRGELERIRATADGLRRINGRRLVVVK